VYWFFAVLYVFLTALFVLDVLRNPKLSGVGKALWIIALVLVPLLAWLVYGFWRVRESRL
jgi:hypothetical protein